MDMQTTLCKRCGKDFPKKHKGNTKYWDICRRCVHKTYQKKFMVEYMRGYRKRDK